MCSLTSDMAKYLKKKLLTIVPYSYDKNTLIARYVTVTKHLTGTTILYCASFMTR